MTAVVPTVLANPLSSGFPEKFVPPRSNTPAPIIFTSVGKPVQPVAMPTRMYAPGNSGGDIGMLSPSSPTTRAISPSGIFTWPSVQGGQCVMSHAQRPSCLAGQKVDESKTGVTREEFLQALGLPQTSSPTPTVGQKVDEDQHSSHRQVGVLYPWGGGRAWACDKVAFKDWIRAAVLDRSGEQHRELYGYLCECFLDADADKDSTVDTEEFDFLIERAAALPRRFGLCPAWVQLYGDISARRAARAKMFQEMDQDNDESIGLEEWVAFAMRHIVDKVESMADHTVDYNHLDQEDKETFLQALSSALSDQRSEEYKSLFECMFRNFVEADMDMQGQIRFEHFDALVDVQSHAVRKAGLAPSPDQLYSDAQAKRAHRKKLFDSMDTNQSGTITFNEYLQFALKHIAKKTDMHLKVGDSGAVKCPISGKTEGKCPLAGVGQALSTS